MLPHSRLQWRFRDKGLYGNIKKICKISDNDNTDAAHDYNRPINGR